LWSTLGIKDHIQATKLLGEYLNRAQKWARVGLPEARPSRQRRRARTCEGFIFRYVYVPVKVVASQERDERGAVDRCWCWFRYLTKQLDERALYALGLTLRCDHSGPCSR
jgi:hypothetical protein